MSFSTFLRPLSLGLLLLNGMPGAMAAPAPRSLAPAVEKQLRQLLRDPVLGSGHLGLAVMALGKVNGPAQYPAVPYDHNARPLLFGVDASKRFLPASNMKLFTAAWVLHRLGPERTFKTGVLTERYGETDANSKIASGAVTAKIVGDGDPSFNSADLQSLAREVVARGYKVAKTTVDGSILGAESMGGRYPDGWTLDDTIWDYGAPVTGLAINRNEVKVTLTGPGSPGEMPRLDCTPDCPIEWRTAVRVGPPDSVQSLHFDRELYAPNPALNQKFGHLWAYLAQSILPGEWEPSVQISGTIRVGGSDEEDIAVTNPEAWAAKIFRAAVGSSEGGPGAAIPSGEGKAPPEAGALVVAPETPQVFSHDSPPLKTLLAQFLKPSDNLYGEMLLRRAAVELPPDAAEGGEHKAVGGTFIASSGLAGRAHADMVRWLIGQGVNTTGLRFSDGSGLSRYNLVTPLAVAQLLGVAQDIPGSGAFYDALPIAGVDGTLKKRMKGTAAEGNVHAKTGTFSIVNCLSGYVTTKDGNRLAVSILTDFEPDGEAIRVWQGKVFALLAGSGG